MRTVLATLLLLGADFVFLPPQSWAQTQPVESTIETSRVFGSYEVFYNVFPSTMLTAEVAGAYKIVRGKDRAVMNVSVRKQQPGGGDVAQTAVVTGKFSDLMQSKALEFREIREEGAIYYIAELRHNDRELLRFDLKIQPDPNTPPYTVTFTRKLYQEP